MDSTISNTIQLPPNRRRALWLKFQGWKHAAIAQSLGLQKVTIDQWSSDPTFKAALVELTNDLDAQSRESLQQLRTLTEAGALQAVTALTQALQKPDMQHGELLSTSQNLLQWFTALHPVPRESVHVAASASVNDGEPAPYAVPYEDTIDVETLP